MELTEIELIKEMVQVATENGKLKAEVEQLNSVVSGLTLALALKNCNIATPFAQLIQSVSAEKKEETHKTTVESPVESVKVEQEPTRQKRKYTRRKKVAEETTKVEPIESVEPITGGTVFKNFEPLELNKIVVEGANTSAYVPTAKRQYNDNIAALAAGLGSSSNI